MTPSNTALGVHGWWAGDRFPFGATSGCGAMADRGGALEDASAFGRGEPVGPTADTRVFFPRPPLNGVCRKADRRLRRRNRGDSIAGYGRLGSHGLYDTSEDPFADQRDNVERPILHLFTDFGRPHWGVLGLGLGAGFLSRFIDLLPPLFLGIAIDAVFLETSVFGLPFVPAAWLPETIFGQFWLSAGLIVGAFLLAAVCNWGSNPRVESLCPGGPERPSRRDLRPDPTPPDAVF